MADDPSEGSAPDGVQNTTNYEILHAAYMKLCAAVEEIYYAAYWLPDRKTKIPPEEMWKRLRDAADLPHGKCMDRLGYPLANFVGLTSLGEDLDANR